MVNLPPRHMHSAWWRQWPAILRRVNPITIGVFVLLVGGLIIISELPSRLTDNSDQSHAHLTLEKDLDPAKIRPPILDTDQPTESTLTDQTPFDPSIPLPSSIRSFPVFLSHLSHKDYFHGTRAGSKEYTARLKEARGHWTRLSAERRKMEVENAADETPVEEVASESHDTSAPPTVAEQEDRPVTPSTSDESEEKRGDSQSDSSSTPTSDPPPNESDFERQKRELRRTLTWEECSFHFSEAKIAEHKKKWNMQQSTEEFQAQQIRPISAKEAKKRARERERLIQDDLTAQVQALREQLARVLSTNPPARPIPHSCSWRFSHYEPSAWENEWKNSMEAIQRRDIENWKAWRTQERKEPTYGICDKLLEPPELEKSIYLVARVQELSNRANVPAWNRLNVTIGPPYAAPKPEDKSLGTLQKSTMQPVRRVNAEAHNIAASSITTTTDTTPKKPKTHRTVEAKPAHGKGWFHQKVNLQLLKLKQAQIAAVIGAGEEASSATSTSTETPSSSDDTTTKKPSPSRTRPSMLEPSYVKYNDSDTPLPSMTSSTNELFLTPEQIQEIYESEEVDFDLLQRLFQEDENRERDRPEPNAPSSADLTISQSIPAPSTKSIHAPSSEQAAKHLPRERKVIDVAVSPPAASEPTPAPDSDSSELQLSQTPVEMDLPSLNDTAALEAALSELQSSSEASEAMDAAEEELFAQLDAEVQATEKEIAEMGRVVATDSEGEQNPSTQQPTTPTEEKSAASTSDVSPSSRRLLSRTQKKSLQVGSKAHMRDAADPLFSRMHYELVCRIGGTASITAEDSTAADSFTIARGYDLVEPLIGLLRDPLSICNHPRPKSISYWLRDFYDYPAGRDIQSKRWLLLQSAAPFAMKPVEESDLPEWVRGTNAQQKIMNAIDRLIEGSGVAPWFFRAPRDAPSADDLTNDNWPFRILPRQPVHGAREEILADGAVRRTQDLLSEEELQSSILLDSDGKVTIPWSLSHGSRFRDPLTRRLSPSAPRTFLFDLGASYFSGWDSATGKKKDELSTSALGSAWFYQQFKLKGLQIDRVYAWEYDILDPVVEWKMIPSELYAEFSFINSGVTADMKSSNNPWNTILEVVRPTDYVIVKLDIDTSKIEVPLMKQLLDTPQLQRLVDEMFFEHHVQVKEMEQFWYRDWSGTITDTYNWYTQLRQAGIRMHSWP